MHAELLATLVPRAPILYPVGIDPLLFTYIIPEVPLAGSKRLKDASVLLIQLLPVRILDHQDLIRGPGPPDGKRRLVVYRDVLLILLSARGPDLVPGEAVEDPALALVA